MPNLFWCRSLHQPEVCSVKVARFIYATPDSDEERYHREQVERFAEPARPEDIHGINYIDNIRSELNHDLLNALEAKVGPQNASEELTEIRQKELLKDIVAQEYLKELKDKGEDVKEWTKKHRELINERVEQIFNAGKIEPKKKATAEAVWNSLGQPQRNEVETYLQSFTPPIRPRFSQNLQPHINLLMSATTAQLEEIRDKVEVNGQAVFQRPVKTIGAAPATRHAPTLFDRLIQLSRVEFQGEYQVMAPSIYNPERLPKFGEDLKNYPGTANLYQLLEQLGGPDFFYAPTVNEHAPDDVKILAQRKKGLKSAIITYVERYLRQHPDPNAPPNPNPAGFQPPDPAAVEKMEERLRQILEGQEITETADPQAALHKKQLSEAMTAISKSSTDLQGLYTKANEVKSKLERELPVKEAKLQNAQAILKRLTDAEMDKLYQASTAPLPAGARIHTGQQAYEAAKKDREIAIESEATLTQEIKALKDEKGALLTAINGLEGTLLAEAQKFFRIMGHYGGVPKRVRVGAAIDDQYPQLRNLKQTLRSLTAADKSTEASLFGVPANPATTPPTPAQPPQPNPLQTALQNFSADNFTAASAEVLKFSGQKLQQRKPIEDLSKLLLALNAQEIEEFSQNLPDNEKLDQAKKDRLSLGIMLYQHRTADEIQELERIVTMKSAEYAAGLTEDEEVRFYQNQEDKGIFSGERALQYLCGLPDHQHFLPFRDISLHMSQAGLEAIMESDEHPERTGDAYELAEKLKVLVEGKAKGRIQRQDAVKMGNFIEKIYRARDMVWERRFHKEIARTSGSRAELITKRLGPAWEAKHEEELKVKEKMAQDKENKWADVFQYDILKAQYFTSYLDERQALKDAGISGEEATAALQEKGLATVHEKLWKARAWHKTKEITKEGTATGAKGLWEGIKWVGRNTAGRALRAGTTALLWGYATLTQSNTSKKITAGVSNFEKRAQSALPVVSDADTSLTGRIKRRFKNWYLGNTDSGS